MFAVQRGHEACARLLLAKGMWAQGKTEAGVEFRLLDTKLGRQLAVDFPLASNLTLELEERWPTDREAARRRLKHIVHHGRLDRFAMESSVASEAFSLPHLAASVRDKAQKLLLARASAAGFTVSS